MHRHVWVLIIWQECLQLWPMPPSFQKMRYLLNFPWVNGKPLFPVNHPVYENLGTMDRLGKQFYLKMIWISAWLAQVFFLLSSYLPHSTRYLSHHKFWLQHQITYQLWVNYQFLIKHSHHDIIQIIYQAQYISSKVYFCSVKFSFLLFNFWLSLDTEVFVINLWLKIGRCVTVSSYYTLIKNSFLVWKFLVTYTLLRWITHS